MKIANLLTNLEFHADAGNAQPLLVDPHGRVIRFMLRPGQSIREHSAPNSPFYVVVVKGQGMFAGSDGVEQQVGPGTLLAFDPDEPHSVRALNEDLVFVGILHGVPGMRPERTGGELGRG